METTEQNGQATIEQKGLTISQVVRKVETTLESFAELYATQLEEEEEVATRPFILYENNLRETQKRQIPAFFSTFHELEHYLLVFIQNTDETSPRYPLLLLLLHKLSLSLSSLPLPSPSNYNNNDNDNNNEDKEEEEEEDNEGNNEEKEGEGKGENKIKESENKVEKIDLTNKNEDIKENKEKEEIKEERGEIGMGMGVGVRVEGEIGVGIRRECGICLSEEDDHDFVSTSFCDHKYCRHCVSTYMEQLIENGRVENICCLDCSSFFTADLIKEIVKESSYEKYAKFSLIAQLKGDVTARFCPQCGMGRKGEAEGLRITCEKCGQEYCFDCQVAWHENISCAQQQKILFKQQKKVDKRLKKMGAKRCPHCGVQTTRHYGCPDMLCLSCNKHWNWYYDDPLWNSDGFTRKDETWIEKVAFYYPRGVKNSLGSRDWENDPEGEYKTVAALLGVIGVVGVPLTVICSPPAVAIRAARKAKLKLKNNKK